MESLTFLQKLTLYTNILAETNRIDFLAHPFDFFDFFPSFESFELFESFDSFGSSSFNVLLLAHSSFRGFMYCTNTSSVTFSRLVW